MSSKKIPQYIEVIVKNSVKQAMWSCSAYNAGAYGKIARYFRVLYKV